MAMDEDENCPFNSDGDDKNSEITEDEDEDEDESDEESSIRSSSITRMGTESFARSSFQQNFPFPSNGADDNKMFQQGENLMENMDPIRSQLIQTTDMEQFDDGNCSEQDCPFFSDSDGADDEAVQHDDKNNTKGYSTVEINSDGEVFDDLFDTNDPFWNRRSLGIQVGNCECARQNLLLEQNEINLANDFTSPLCCVDGCDLRRLALVKIFRRLIRVSRIESNRLKKELHDASLRLLTKPHVKCPNCHLEFRDSSDKRIIPSYVKMLRGSMTLELHFDTIEAMYEWAFIHGIEKDRHNIPTLLHTDQITEYMSLREVNSFMPELAVEMTKEMFRRQAEERSQPKKTSEPSDLKDEPEFIREPEKILMRVRKRKRDEMRQAEKSNVYSFSSEPSTSSNNGRNNTSGSVPMGQGIKFPKMKKTRKVLNECRICLQLLKTSFLWEYFNHPICDACRDVNGAHRLVPRSEAISKYGFKTVDLDSSKPLLRFVTLSPDGSGERFYLMNQIEERMLELNAGLDKLRHQIKQRERDKENLPPTLMISRPDFADLKPSPKPELSSTNLKCLNK